MLGTELLGTDELLVTGVVALLEEIDCGVEELTIEVVEIETELVVTTELVVLLTTLVVEDGVETGGTEEDWQSNPTE